MARFFKKVNSLEELKAEYRRLAMKHHPDVGGDNATMQEINAEYDRLFPIYKLSYNRTASEPTHETAESTRSEFYTANGWRGSRYNSSISTKEIAAEIRSYLKSAYPDCKFSVTTKYASMCAAISVYLMSGPYEALRNGKSHKDLNYFYVEKDEDLTEWALAVMNDVNDCIKSYHFSDCDGMIDYFDVNFYYSIGVGTWEKPYTVNAKQKKLTTKEQPKQKAESQIRVVFNDEMSGIEVYFPTMPSEAKRTALKQSGFRWHRMKKCWYAKNNEKNLQALRAIEEVA